MKGDVDLNEDGQTWFFYGVFPGDSHEHGQDVARTADRFPSLYGFCAARRALLRRQGLTHSFSRCD